ncbi:MAG TPA: pyridoxamine 5'-phosphate oxidase family protein [Candidatus Scatomorpha pullistercoris]|uniref:Pyridoxamine 5'-phosphate oxidase family protein n=1 Tax=Candidatus Scatomorpha pullistercoris TaxID=2840929 RepID=A0A9D1G503_9FIRM|nr:pyridoxamine 5'-phosphate oxidase family protein [Candidatus Scatomorpha pullistercoris]
MFRKMRRSKQELPADEALRLLEAGSSGVLALLGDGGWPYAVPLSYAYAAGKLYFHCARAGHKLDAVRSEPRASFCVVAQDLVVPEKYTTHYRSVIAFGRVRILEDGDEKRRGIELLAERFAPDDSAGHRRRVVDSEWDNFCVLEFDIEHITGKEAKI